MAELQIHSRNDWILAGSAGSAEIGVDNALAKLAWQRKLMANWWIEFLGSVWGDVAAITAQRAGRGIASLLVVARTTDGPEAADSRLATFYETQFDGIVAALGGTGWLSGCGLAAQATPDATRVLSAGRLVFAGTPVDVSEQTSDAVGADGALPLWVLYEVDSSAVLHTTLGVPALKCLIPELVAGRCCVGADLLRPQQTRLTGAVTLDMRFPVNPLATVGGAEVLVSGAQSSPLAVVADGLHVYDVPVSADLPVVLGAPTLTLSRVVRLLLRGTGATATVTISAGSRPLLWANGTPPLFDATDGNVTVVALLWSGTEWLGDWSSYQ